MRELKFTEEQIKDVKNVMPLLQAISEGKNISTSLYEDFSPISLETTVKELHNILPRAYTILYKPRYRPYKTIDEAMELMGKIIKRKDFNSVFMVDKIVEINSDIYIDGNSMNNIFNLYEYYDNSMRHIPLGVKE